MALLFSYGTLQQESVQVATFGRRLQGQPDELVGFAQSLARIEDPTFVAESGKRDHAIVSFNGKSGSRVRGTVFEVTDGELESADRYEPSGYRRIPTILASGKRAWVYADAGSACVRPAREADAGAITDLTRQLGYDAHADAVSRRLSRILARPDQEVFVAESGGRPVGWVHAEIAAHIESDPFVVIGGLVVDTEHRGRGIGRALMEQAETWAREQGCSVVRLRSSTTRTAAHRFYERLGYVNIKAQYTFAKLVDPSAPEPLSRLVPRVDQTRRHS